MGVSRILLIATLASGLAIVGFSTASSRNWKATPQAKARDYVTINDSRPDGNLVMLLWFVPQMVQPDAPGAEILSAMLQKYILLLVVHGHIERTTGSVTFEDIATLEAMDQSGKALKHVPRNELPPTTIGTLVGVETMFRQMLGAMGNGMKMFVFDAGTVNSCRDGKLSVPLAGESYTWDTPIPGCS